MGSGTESLVRRDCLGRMIVPLIDDQAAIHIDPNAIIAGGREAIGASRQIKVAGPTC